MGLADRRGTNTRLSYHDSCRGLNP